MAVPLLEQTGCACSMLGWAVMALGANVLSWAVGRVGGGLGWPGTGRQVWRFHQGPDTAADLSTLCLGRRFKPLWEPPSALILDQTSHRGQQSHGAKQCFSVWRSQDLGWGLQAALSHRSC